MDLFEAIKENKIEKVEAALEAALDIRGAVREERHMEIYGTTGECMVNPLGYAVLHSNGAVMHALLETGVNPDTEFGDISALQLAA